MIVMEELENDVRDFTSKYHKIPDEPREFTYKEISFIRDMVNSEIDEMILAMLDTDDVTEIITDQSDALLDAVYYLINCLVKHGVYCKPLWDRIQKANMDKFKEGVKLDERGKVLKPENWESPRQDMINLIQEQINIVKL